MSEKNQKISLIIILLLLLGALGRLLFLGRGDPISDEVLYGFRSIGYLDFDFARYQPGLLQLFDNQVIPWWTKLSFHDHPALVFLVQHIFMKLGGANLWALRLPSVLFGLASVYLLYLIGRKWFSPLVGILAAALLSANVLMFYLSRTAVQESQVLFFMLLTVYLFSRALERPKYFLWTGLAFGLALLSKYTVLFLVPAFILYLTIFQREHFRSRYLYSGAGLALLVASPLIIYNILLFKTFGHFDFQWSYILGQEVSYWQVSPGKEIGTVVERFVGIFQNLWLYNSAIFNILALTALAVFISSIWRPQEGLKRQNIFLFLILFFNFLLYLLIGPSPRFLSMLVPWLALLTAWLLVYLWENFFKNRLIIFLSLVTLIFVWENFYAWNSYVFYRPLGYSPWTYSQIHWDMHPYGFNQLDQYLEDLLSGQYPALTIPYKYNFLEEIKIKSIEQARAHGGKEAKILIIYDQNIQDLAALWIFDRRALYQAWPILPLSAYQRLQADLGEDWGKQLAGFNLYFIQPAENILLVKESDRTVRGNKFAESLKSQEINPFIIYNSAEQAAFYVYHWQLE